MKLNLTNPSTFVSDASAVAQTTANNAAISTAVENTLSRDGTGPNTMGADFDMNSHRILNLPTPVSALEPVRLIDVSTAPGLVGALAKINNLSDLTNVATAKVNLSLVKADVGLGNVDNTSDVNKPVSTAQAAADTAVSSAAATATALKANIASPTFTGVPAAPTATAGTNTTQLATTAFVDAARVILAASDALKAPLASPALTGTPTAPTATFGTNTTQLATTAFVLANAPSGLLLPGNVAGVVPTTATVTITIAAPGVIAWTAHGLQVGTPITLATTGALPTGLVAGTGIVGGTVYNVIPVDANHFSLASSYANAVAGTAITTTGSQSGAHTAVANGVLLPGMKGYLYEVELIPGAAISLPFQVSTQLFAFTLPAGMYDCHANIDTVNSAGVVVSEMHASISTTAPPSVVSFPNEGGNDGSHILSVAGKTTVVNLGPKRFSLPSGGTVYTALYSSYGTDTGGTNGLGGLQGMYGYFRAVVL